MSVQIITGGSGSGKSHYIYEKIIRESMEHPERRYLVIIPEQFSMAAQRELIRLSPRKGLLNVDVLSFQRLAHRVFDEVGGSRRSVLGETGKSLLLRKVIRERQKELPHLGKTLSRTGAVPEMKSLISEFLQYRVSPDALASLAAGDGNEQLKRKLADTAVVYRAFMECRGEKYLMAEEIPDVLCEVIDRSEKLAGCTVVLDSFAGFTPAQEAVIRKLMHICRDLYAVVTLDGREDPYKKDAPHHLFHMSRVMIRTLTELAKEAGCEMLPPVRISPEGESRFREAPALSHLEQNLFRAGSAPARDLAAEDTITVFRARDPEDELTCIAGRIRRLVREKGYSFGDFAVVTGDLETYGRIAPAVFARAGIPCFVDRKYPVMQNMLVEFIRAAVDMVFSRFSCDSVFRYLRSGLSDLTVDETDRMENYVLALGIKNRSQYEDKWIRIPRAWQNNHVTDVTERLEELNSIRERFVQETAGLTEGLRERMGCALHKTETIVRFLLQLRVPGKLEAMEQRFLEQGESALAMEYRQIWRVVTDLLDKVAEVLGDEPMGMEEYQQILDAGFQETQVGLTPPGIDQVMIGDIRRTRLCRIRVLFLAGANDGVIPAAPAGKSILSDRDREFLAAHGTRLAPGEREQMFQQRFYLYQNLTKPSDRLVLSYTRMSVSGEALTPSYLIAAVRELFQQLHKEETGTDKYLEMETPAGIEDRFLSDLRKTAETDPQSSKNPLSKAEFPELLRYYRAEPGRKAQSDRMICAAFYSAADQSDLDERLARKLFGTELYGSPSRLEMFARCPFAHFAGYGLDLKDREEFKFGTPDLGNVLHDILRRFAESLKRDGLSWDSLPQERLESLAESAVDEVVNGYGNTVLRSTGRNEHLICRIRELALRTVSVIGEQLARGSFRPDAFEQRIGRDGELTFPLGEGAKLILSGTIDRVDLCRQDDVLYVRIIDYKTGDTDLDFGKLMSGLQLQLPLYLSAALVMERKRFAGMASEPAAILYYHVEDPFGKDEDNADPLKMWQMSGLVRSEGEVLRLLDRSLVPGGSSAVIPVRLNKDGSVYGKGTHTAGLASFFLLDKFVRKKACELGREILRGNTYPAPAVRAKDGMDACEWCRFRGVCGFEPRTPGYKQRMVQPLDRDEALAAMAAYEDPGAQGAGNLNAQAAGDPDAQGGGASGAQEAGKEVETGGTGMDK